MNFEHSIVNLVKKLCYTVRNENHQHHPSAAVPFNTDHHNFRHPFVRLAYEILLNKSTHLPVPPSHPLTTEDLQTELEFCRFEMKLAAASPCASYTAQQRSQQFDVCLDAVTADNLLDDDGGRTIFQFLLALKNSVAPQDLNPNRSIGLSNFYFNAQNDLNRRPYRLIPNELIRFPAGDTFSSTNPYLPADLFADKNENRFMKLLLDQVVVLAPPSAEASIFRSIMPKPKMATSEQRYQSVLNKYGRCYEAIEKEIVGQREPSAEPPPIFMKSLRWEYMRELVDSKQREQSFASESEKAYFHMLADDGGTVKLMAVDRFIDDVKLLLIGIESLTFRYDEEVMCFRTVSTDVTIENVAKMTLATFVQNFLECGTCFARLRILCTTDSGSFEMKFNGFVFQALCKCVEEYLTQFGRVVLNFNDRTVLKLSQRLSPMMQQIRMLAKVLAIHPDGNFLK